ncbi:hypothetical protein BD779DRAFT_1487380 [Infundibulicybe gibba]|nr:hypothetical protein BD779DRAFT_1487380 [Infundibulicybe gibba]
MTVPYIPLELTEAIIEQLAGSPPSLCACALVSNAWLPVAFRVLFRTFAVRVYGVPPDLSIFATRMYGVSSSPRKLHAGLIFPHYVSSLTIGNSPGREISPSILEGVLALFDHAHRISIYSEFTPLLDVLHQTHPHLREFEITSAPFTSVHGLQTFVAAFSHLEHLSMSYFGFGMRNEVTSTNNHYPSGLRPPPRLSSLVYKSSDIHRAPFLRWLSCHQPTIRHLILLYLSPKELEPATAFFHALGPHLHCLGISYRDDTPAPQPQPPTYLPLEANTHLHTLRISRIPLSLADSNPHLRIPPTLLDSIGPTLHCIALQLARGNISNDQHDTLEWDDLDTMLARRAPALECLHIHVFDTPLYETFPFMRAILEVQMPWCSRRGALRGMDVVISHREFAFPLHEKLSPVLAPEP